MNKGFLLFAHDNEEVRYGIMALWQARRIRKFLDCPTSIVTDQDTVDNIAKQIPDWRDSFDQVILSDSSAVQKKMYIDRELTFHNVDRASSWDLTPYEETIVVDTDIIIQSDSFNKLWNYSADLVVCKNSPNLYGEYTEEFTWVSERSLPFYWATAFFFRKNQESKLFFDHCKYIKDFYGWFRYVYELMSGPVRNDFVWSIALHNLGGQAGADWAPIIPWPLLHTENKDHILKMSDSATRFLTPKGLCLVKNQDIHVLNKFDLFEKIKEELGIAQ